MASACGIVEPQVVGRRANGMRHLPITCEHVRCRHVKRYSARWPYDPRVDGANTQLLLRLARRGAVKRRGQNVCPRIVNELLQMIQTSEAWHLRVILIVSAEESSTMANGLVHQLHSHEERKERG